MNSKPAAAPPLAAPTGSAISLRDFQKAMESLNRWAQHGCTNHGCRIEPPKGMGTNAICSCTPRAFAEHLLWLACELDKHGKYGCWPNAQGERPLEAK
jgi:hypothetical protein